MLPVRFEDVELEGLPPSVAYVDARAMQPEALGSIIVEKLRILEHSYETPRGEQLDVWRLVRFSFAGSAFSGETAAEVGGRWSSRGTRAVYATSSLCVAVLERATFSAEFLFDETLRALGDEWVVAGETCVLSVPSRVLPGERVYLLNPTHPDFGSLAIVAEEPIGRIG